MSIEDRDWIRDEAPRGWSLGGLSPVFLLIAVTTAAFIVQAAVENSSAEGEMFVQSRLALSLAGVRRGDFWQPVTYLLLHGGLSHLFWNMVGLYIFGSILEDLVSPRSFWVHYVLGGAAGAAAHLAWALAGLPGAGAMVVGASGAVMAVLTAASLRAPRRPIRMWFIPGTIPLWVLGAFYVALNLVGAVEQWARLGGAGTSFQAHLGGAVAAVVLFLAPRIPGRRASAPRRSRREEIDDGDVLVPAHRDTDDTAEEARMDALLARIHASGIGSLTEEERAFLKRVSERYRGRRR